VKQILTVFQILCLLRICFLYAHSEILIIQSSDQHSSYSRWPHFLASVEILSRKFKNKYPEGQVIIVINGDLSSQIKFWSKEEKQKFLNNKGRNLLAEKDKGTLSYELLADLARKHTVLYTFGNHDAFDWQDSQLFLDQMNILKESGVHILAANVKFASNYQHLFQPFIDIQTSHNKTIRFMGFTLPNNSKNNWAADHNAIGPSVILNILNSNQLLKTIRAASKSPKVHSLVLSFHMGFNSLQKIFSNAPPRDIKNIKLIISGHDHIPVAQKMKLKQSLLIGAGAYFNFSTILLDYNGNVKKTEFFTSHDSKQHSHLVNKYSLEYTLIQRAKLFVHHLLQHKKLKRNNIYFQNTHHRPCYQLFNPIKI